jgi:hypothetical protein
MENANSEIKCVLVIDETLPQGLAVNAAAVLALTLGRRIDSIVGPDLEDASGTWHVGITTIPIPILRAGGPQVRQIRLAAGECDGLLVVDFTDAAQLTTTYDAYAESLVKVPTDQLRYFGVALYGPKKDVNSLTGSLPLMR